jgi:hypothetical protein
MRTLSAITVAALSFTIAVGQAPKKPAAKAPVPKAWVQGHTSDGQPDLQGVWLNATVTPFERPAEFAGKEYLTEQEAAAIEKRAADSRVDAPPKAGDVGSYNQVWFEPGTKVVGTRRTSLVVDPPNGIVPVKPEAEAKRDADLARNIDSYEYMGQWDRCITRGMPGAMYPAGYNNAYQIVQTPGYVLILAEMIHDARIVPVDARPKLPSQIKQWNGDSRGHWEGNTLVIETANFAGKGWIAANAAAGRIRGVPQSDQAHIVEKFTRVDANTIHYEVTIDDPKWFTKPWKLAFPFNRDPDYRLYEYACHEGNRALENILRGGREKDKGGE